MSTLENGAPAVSKLNLSELVIPRPHVEDPSAAIGVNGRRPSLLGQVVEEADEEEGDDRPETDLQSDTFPPFRSSAFRSARSDDNNGKNAIEQETLRFLERLDLKTVLHTPRPEVDNFFPAARPDVNARVDAEEGRALGHEYGLLGGNCAGRQRPAPPPLGPVKEAFHHRPLPRSVRKGTDQVAAGRLAHMESTYGTTKFEPRKARRETIDRLANPIAGYTSTLQALSPEQRRKRELALESTSSDNNSSSGSSRANGVDRRVESPQKAANAAPSLLDQLTNAASAYHMAAISAGVVLAASPAKSKPRFGQNYQPTIVTTSNNQVEDQLSSLAGGKSGRGGSKSSARRAAALAARKQALKAKLRGREGDAAASDAHEDSAPARDWVTTCSTFLTQREDEEAELALPPKSSRPAVPPLQAAQQSAESMNKSRHTPRSTRTTPPSSGNATLNPELDSKAAVLPLASFRKRPSRPVRVVPRDRGDSSSRSGVADTSGRKTPHPPPRPSNGSAAAAPPARRPNPRQSQRKSRDASPHKAINGAGTVSKPTGRATIPLGRGSLPAASSGKNSTGRKQEPTPSKAAKDRPATPTAATILMGSTDPTVMKKTAAREGRPRKGSDSTKNNDSHGVQEPPRGPRVRLVPSRRLSNGSVSVGSATAPTARRSDQKRAQSPSRGGRRANGNDSSDSVKTGRKTAGPARAARAPAITSSSSRQQRTAS